LIILKCFIILSENMVTTETYRQSNLNGDTKKSLMVSKEIVAVQSVAGGAPATVITLPNSGAAHWQVKLVDELPLDEPPA